ncbi:MAG: hypothetical protein WBL02_09270 [Methanomethylovorans sp.]|uniref:hypothetical protein n=1 Tax=Methanomethylovorans sp. TaxID=2758717 RepID=UPI000A9FC69D|nr:hypothetical protein [Methanomethylovorans sp.]
MNYYIREFLQIQTAVHSLDTDFLIKMKRLRVSEISLESKHFIENFITKFHIEDNAIDILVG